MRLFLFLLLPSLSYASECPVDRAKLHFVETCTGYLEGVALRGGGSPSNAKIKEECRCAALNFAVENLVRTDCEYNLDEVYTTMNLDAVKLRCR
jgi:hypothetical protein